MTAFDVVWRRIVALQGETFHQKTGPGRGSGSGPPCHSHGLALPARQRRSLSLADGLAILLYGTALSALFAVRVFIAPDDSGRLSVVRMRHAGGDRSAANEDGRSSQSHGPGGSTSSSDGARQNPPDRL